MFDTECSDDGYGVVMMVVVVTMTVLLMVVQMMCLRSHFHATCIIVTP